MKEKVKEPKWKIYYSSPTQYVFSPDLTNDVKFCRNKYEVLHYLEIVNQLMFSVYGNTNYKYLLEEKE